MCTDSRPCVATWHVKFAERLINYNHVDWTEDLSERRAYRYNSIANFVIVRCNYHITSRKSWRYSYEKYVYLYTCGNNRWFYTRFVATFITSGRVDYETITINYNLFSIHCTTFKRAGRYSFTVVKYISFNTIISRVIAILYIWYYVKIVS